MLNIIKVSQNYVEKWNEESFEPKFLRNIKAGNDIVTTYCFARLQHFNFSVQLKSGYNVSVKSQV